MKQFMFLLYVVIFLFTSCTKSVDAEDGILIEKPSDNGMSSTVNKTVLLQLVNEVRKKGCQCGDTWYAPAPALAWNDQLEQAAFNHSLDMYRNNFFNHTSPGGTNPGDRIRQVGYSWKAYGENIGMGYRNEKEVVEAWVGSPGHCKNLMGKQFKDMGVGRAGSYWTQDFGAR